MRLRPILAPASIMQRMVMSCTSVTLTGTALPYPVSISWRQFTVCTCRSTTARSVLYRITVTVSWSADGNRILLRLSLPGVLMLRKDSTFMSCSCLVALGTCRIFLWKYRLSKWTAKQPSRTGQLKADDNISLQSTVFSTDDSFHKPASPLMPVMLWTPIFFVAAHRFFTRV